MLYCSSTSTNRHILDICFILDNELWPNLTLKLLQQKVGLFSGEIGDATSLRMNKARNIVMCWIFVSPLILEASCRKGYLLTCCRIVIFSCCHQPVVAHWSLLAGGALSPDWVELATLLGGGAHTLPQKQQHSLSRAEVIMRTHNHYPG